jgi:hypothetical protein
MHSTGPSVFIQGNTEYMEGNMDQYWAISTFIQYKTV